MVLVMEMDFIISTIFSKKSISIVFIACVESHTPRISI